MKADIKSSDIARKAAVTPALVSRVINRQSTSDRIQRMIARAIRRPVAEVFPDHYDKPRKKDLSHLDEPQRSAI